jgi:hypothetical protein
LDFVTAGDEISVGAAGAEIVPDSAADGEAPASFNRG